jgi:hypothetical protein
MKLAHIFTAIAALLLAGTLFLPYQTRLSYEFSLFSSTPLGGLPTRTYIAGLELPETWPPAIALFLVAVSLFISRQLATAIIGLVLSCLMLLYMAFLAFILTFQLFGPSKDLGIGYFLALLVVVGFLPLMIVHLSKTIRKGREVKVREDVLDM